MFLYVLDQVGVPRELLDERGRVAWSGRFSAWGALEEEYVDPYRVSQERRVSTPFRLLGQILDEESGLAWTRFRVWDAATGRWLSPDSLGLFGGENAYAFDASPLEWSDPLGLSTGAAHPPKKAPVLKRDTTKGPHAPDTPIGEVIDRANGTGKPQGRWNSVDAAERAAGAATPGKKDTVPIQPGDGVVVYPLPNNGGVMIREADKAVVIPKKAGNKDVSHTFPIGPEHPDY